jgi:hypothetical protein
MALVQERKTNGAMYYGVHVLLKSAVDRVFKNRIKKISQIKSITQKGIFSQIKIAKIETTFNQIKSKSLCRLGLNWQFWHINFDFFKW